MLIETLDKGSGNSSKSNSYNLECEISRMFRTTFSRILAFLVLFFTVRKSFQMFYPRVYNDFVIARGIFSVMENVDWLSCIQHCLNTESCLSYNYDVLGTQNHSCELSKCAGVLKDGCSKKNLRFSKGFVYQQLKENQNKVS